MDCIYLCIALVAADVSDWCMCECAEMPNLHVVLFSGTTEDRRQCIPRWNVKEPLAFAWMCTVIRYVATANYYYCCHHRAVWQYWTAAKETNASRLALIDRQLMGCYKARRHEQPLLGPVFDSDVGPIKKREPIYSIALVHRLSGHRCRAVANDQSLHMKFCKYDSALDANAIGTMRPNV